MTKKIVRNNYREVLQGMRHCTAVGVTLIGNDDIFHQCLPSTEDQIITERLQDMKAERRAIPIFSSCLTKKDDLIKFNSVLQKKDCFCLPQT